MKPVFAVVLAFDPKPGDSAAACFDKLASAAAGWVEAEHPGFRVQPDGTPTSPANGETVTAARERIDSFHELFTLEWTRPGEADDVRLACAVELARTPIGIQGRAEVRAGASGGGPPVRVDPTRPGVIDRWCAAAVGRVVGGEEIPTAVRRVSGRFVPGFAEDLLLAPSRQLPAVVLAPLPDGRPLVDPDLLLDAAFGLAHVVELTDTAATFALTDRVGKEWSCFHGAVRIYWPQPSLGDDFRRHPLFFPAAYPPGPDTDDRLPRDVLARLCDAAVVRHAAAPLVKQVRAAQEKARQAAVQKQIADLTANAAEGAGWMSHLDAAWDEVRKLKDELEFARLERDEARKEAADFREQWATVAAEIAAAEDQATRAAAVAKRYRDRVLKALKKVGEAVDLAADEFADTLRFLPSARQSADESPYQQPARVYDLFRALDEVGRELRTRGQLGRSLFDALRDRGFEYKPHISMTSEGKYGGEYTFEYGGRKHLFENHVTIGSSHSPRECLSVHWLRDDAAGRFVVGWCGRHLTNTRT